MDTDKSRWQGMDRSCNAPACVLNVRLCRSVSQVTALQQQLQSSKNTSGRVDQQASRQGVVMCTYSGMCGLAPKLRPSILHSPWKDRGKMELVTSRTAAASEGVCVCVCVSV